MKNLLLLGTVCLSLSLPAASAPVQSNPSGYHLIDSVRLAGEGGWDLYGLDTASQRLYISRGTRVQVVDCAKDSLIGEIPNTNGVHGIAVAPCTPLVFGISPIRESFAQSTTCTRVPRDI